MSRKGNTLVTNFSAGELDPKLKGRPDLTAYAQGASKMRNLLPFATGGCFPRPGTRFGQALPGKERIIEFIFDDDEKYLIGFAHNLIRFYDPDMSLLQQLAAPWAESAIFDITYAQAYDVLFLAHRNMPRQKVTRTGLSTFTIEAFQDETFSTGMSKKPFWSYHPASYGIVMSADSGNIAVGIYKDNGATPVTDYWTADHVGRVIRVKHTNADEAGEILLTGPYTAGSQNMPGTVVGTFSVAGTIAAFTFTTDWAEEAFNATRGYPSAVGIVGERLWWGGGHSAPEGIWASRINGFFDYAIGPNDDDPMQFGLKADRVHEVRHIIAPKEVGFLTRDGEWIVEEPAGGGGVTPATIEPKSRTKYGSPYGVRPLSYDGATLFVQRNGRNVREMRYDDLEQSYQSDSASLLAGHLVRNPVDTAVQYGTPTRPEEYAYFVNDDGSLAVFHGLRDQKVAGWQLLHLGPDHEGDGGYTMDDDNVDMASTTVFSMDADNPAGRFISVACLDDTVYAVVERESSYSLEKFEEELMVDMAKTVSLTAPGRVFTSLSHLEGKTAWAVWNGNVLGSGVVVDGTLDLSAAAIPEVTDVDIGLFYGITLRLMPADFSDGRGEVSAGRVRRIIKAIVIPEKLQRIKVNGWPLIQRTQTIAGVTFAQPLDTPAEFYQFDSTREPAIEIVNDQPTSGSILAVNIDVER